MLFDVSDQGRPIHFKLGTHRGTFLFRLALTKLKCLLQQSLFIISKAVFHSSQPSDS